jgi:regulatory protein
MTGAPDTPEQLRSRALRHLVRREHSRAELARKLAPHAESPAALEALLDQLSAKKMLSDERYAHERARSLARKYGAARIRQDLKAKGVDRQIIAAVSAGDELERARAILSRKYRAPADTPKERARRARFLQGRGFSIAVIGELLRDSEDLLLPVGDN